LVKACVGSGDSQEWSRIMSHIDLGVKIHRFYPCVNSLGLG
jgi:hypothetical protein